MSRVNVETAAYLAAVANAILEAEKGAGGGDLYVKEVRFAIAGEDVPVRLVINDIETFDISVDGDV